MSAKREQLEYLQKHAQWMNDRIPEIMTVSEAFSRQSPRQHFYTVLWWGKLPSGFTRFDFKRQIGLAYEIILHHEPDFHDDLLEADELVLMFTSRDDE